MDKYTIDKGIQIKMTHEFLHNCHAKNCNDPIFNEYFMCPKHWNMVPNSLQNLIVRTANEDKAFDINYISLEWIKYGKEAIEIVKFKEEFFKTNDFKSTPSIKRYKIR